MYFFDCCVLKDGVQEVLDVLFVKVQNRFP
jgi:hypothetical protein